MQATKVESFQDQPEIARIDLEPSQVPRGQPKRPTFEALVTQHELQAVRMRARALCA